MTAFNVVRFRVKPGHDQHFLDAHRAAKPKLRGMRQANMVKTGEGTYCIIGEWASMKALAGARAEMIGMLDSFRADLEDLGGGLGVTDPVSGESVLTLRPAGAKKSAKKAKKAKKKAKKAKKGKKAKR